MEWGYGWGLGPFRLLDARRRGARWPSARGPKGAPIPPLVESLLASGRKRFYEVEDGRHDRLRSRRASSPVPERPGVIDLAALKRARAR